MPLDGDTWNERYAELVAYKKKTGHMLVHTAPDTKRLRDWVYTQRKASDNIRKDRKKRLKAIGFEWESGGHLEKQWDDKFLELKSFTKKKGHCYITAKDQGLGNWAGRQRKLYRDGTLRQDRLDRLNSIEFPWVVGPGLHPNQNNKPQPKTKIEAPPEIVESQDANSWANERWDVMYKELQAFEAAHGDCCVSKHQDVKLCKWVSRQRSQRAEDKLPKYRENKLEALGFAWRHWEAPTLEIRWNKMLKVLKAFKEAHGHCNVPFMYENNRSLGWWVATQRRNGHRREDRAAKLDALGFIWTLREDGEEDTEAPSTPTRSKGKRKASDLENEADDEEPSTRSGRKSRRDKKLWDEAVKLASETSVRSTRTSRKAASLEEDDEQSQLVAQKADEDDTQETDEDDTQEIEVDDSPYAVGTALMNFFPGHGWYKGTVTAVTRTKYLVKYEDGDKEEFRIDDPTVDALVELAKSHPDIGQEAPHVKGGRRIEKETKRKLRVELQAEFKTREKEQEIERNQTVASLKSKCADLENQVQTANDSLSAEVNKRQEEWETKMNESIASLKSQCVDLENQAKSSNDSLSVAQAELKKMESVLRRRERQCAEKDNLIDQLTVRIDELEQSQFVAGSVGQKVLSRMQGKSKKK